MTGYEGATYEEGTAYDDTAYDDTANDDTANGDPRQAEPAYEGPVGAEPDEPAAPALSGHPAVDAALRTVAAAEAAAPADQIAAYQAAHRTLRETLASIDE